MMASLARPLAMPAFVSRVADRRGRIAAGGRNEGATPDDDRSPAPARRYARASGDLTSPEGFGVAEGAQHV